MRVKLTKQAIWLPAAILTLLIQHGFARADNWPNWRGPNENGTSQDAKLPLRWAEDQGMAWKTALPGWGDSTPVVWGDSIFLTSQVDEKKLVLVKLQKASGRIEWVRDVGEGEPPRAEKMTTGKSDRGRQRFHNTQNMATPSAVTDGQVVIAHFGNGDLAAYDFDGRRLWLRNLAREHGTYTIWWGHANSPVLFCDLVICVCMQDSLVDLDKPASPSYLVAYDKKTGEPRWKTMRMTKATSEPCDSYTTPLFWRRGDQTQMLVMGGLVLDAYHPATGKQIWALEGLEGNRVITGPAIWRDLAIVTQGMRRPTIAVRLGGNGAKPATDIVWQEKEATPDSPTPAVAGDRLYFVADNGIAKCLDAATGKQIWKERLPGQYRASPLAAAGRVYFINMDGLCTVVAAADKFERLAENKIDDNVIASPIAVDGRIYLRGKKSIYCVTNDDKK
jgi:outer membrane protein assembly factor BamB